MSTLLFEVTIALGFVFPLALYFSYRRGGPDGFHLRAYGIGTALGATWEFGLVFINERGFVGPLYTMSATVRVPTPLHALSHSFWDGALFLVGVFLIQLLYSDQGFVNFRWKELSVLLAWGQFQSIVVEVFAVLTGLWSYNPAWWNPAIVTIGDAALTVVPQLIWLLAMFVFYLWCLRFVQSSEMKSE